MICGNISSQSFANTEIPNRYQTYQGESIVIDNSKNGNIESETIYDTIKNEADLIEVLIGNSRYIDKYEYINNEDESNLCPKGFVLGYCDDNTSNNCEYSALNRDGLCGAECLDCMGDILASAKEKAYVCSCSKISFENNF